MRDCTIETVTQDFPEEWQSVNPDKLIESLTTCEFELAEEVIGLVRYIDGTFEVGIGESLRPYSRLYSGAYRETANERFWQAVTLHVRNM